MGKPAASALSCGRSHITAWLAEAGGALASIFLPVGCRLCDQLLTNASRLPHQGVLVVRKRPWPGKLLLKNRERWEAVRGAFATRPGSQVDNKRVLLVDDVMTTGATLDACAKALREAGASTVVGLTVARAILNPRKVSR